MRLPLIAVLALAAACRPLDASAPIDPADDSTGPRFDGRLVEGTQLVVLRVIDGDTIVVNGETVRLANIDAPEKAPRAECLAEAQLAIAATRELEALLGANGLERGRAFLRPLERQGQDRFGRTLATLDTVMTGEDIGELMIQRGVALPWTGRQADWCATD